MKKGPALSLIKKKKNPAIVLWHRSPGQVDLTQVSVTWNGPKGFTLDIDTVKSKPPSDPEKGGGYLMGHWTIDVGMPSE